MRPVEEVADSDTPKTYVEQQEYYRKKILDDAYPTFGSYVLDVQPFLGSEVYQLIDFQKLYEHLGPWMGMGRWSTFKDWEIIVAVCGLPGVYFVAEHFKIYDASFQLTGKQRKQLSIPPSSLPTLFRLLALHGKAHGFEYLRALHKGFLLGMSSTDQHLLTDYALQSGSAEMVETVFETLSKPFTNWDFAEAISSNNWELINFVWENNLFKHEFSQKYSSSSQFFEKKIFSAIFDNGSDQGLAFLLEKRDEFSEAVRNFNWTIGGRSPVQRVLTSQHPRSIHVLKLLIAQKVVFTMDDLCEASDLEKFNFMISVFPPTFLTLITVIRHGPQFLSRLFDFNIPLDEWRLRQDGRHSPDGISLDDFLCKFAAVQPSHPLSQEFFYYALAKGSPDFHQRLRSLTKTWDFIKENREAILYWPLLRSVILPEKTRAEPLHARIEKLFMISGKSLKNLPAGSKIFLEHKKHYECFKDLLGGWRSPYPDRILAHIFLILLLETQIPDQAAFISSARKLGQEKIYHALSERLQLLPQSSLQLLRLALHSGIFENKDPTFFGENFYKKIADQIEALQPKNAPARQDTQLPHIPKSTLFLTKKEQEKAIKPNNLQRKNGFLEEDFLDKNSRDPDFTL